MFLVLTFLLWGEGAGRGGGASIAALALSAAAPALAQQPALPAANPAAEFLSRPEPGSLRASKLVGIKVIGMDHVRVGEIEDVLLTEDGRVRAVVIGVGGCLGYFYGSNLLLDSLLPASASNDARAVRNLQLQSAIRPWLFLAPALILLVIYLVYPVFQTIWLSFHNKAGRTTCPSSSRQTAPCCWPPMATASTSSPCARDFRIRTFSTQNRRTCWRSTRRISSKASGSISRSAGCRHC